MQNKSEISVNKIRAAGILNIILPEVFDCAIVVSTIQDEALRDHSISFYHNFEPFIDDSFGPHLFAYEWIKFYFKRLGTYNLPLYSGFTAIHLPHTIRSRHKVTFLAPINEDPNKISSVCD